MHEFEVGVPKPPHHAACPLLCQIFPECGTPRPDGADGFDAGVLYERQRTLTKLQAMLRQCEPGAEHAALRSLRDFIVQGDTHKP